MQNFKQEKSPIKQRILQYIECKGVSRYRFYKESSITRNVLDQPTGISEDNIIAFIKYAQDISLNWLLTGEGEMFKPIFDNNKQMPVNNLSIRSNTVEYQTKQAEEPKKDINNRLLLINESQQRTIEELTGIVKTLTSK